MRQGFSHTLLIKQHRMPTSLADSHTLTTDVQVHVVGLVQVVLVAVRATVVAVVVQAVHLTVLQVVPQGVQVTVPHLAQGRAQGHVRDIALLTVVVVALTAALDALGVLALADKGATWQSV